MRFLRSCAHARKNALVGATLALFAMWPMTSSAIQLKWGNGSTSLTATQATRSRVILLADSARALPTIWRLTWAADTSGLQFSAADSLVACETDTSKVSALDPPSTVVDTSANQSSAHFCSVDNNSAEVAYFYADIVGNSTGKIKVVALLDGANPDSVIESNEITYNGGISADYPPTPLRATSEHKTALLQVTVVGSSLTKVHAVSIGADDRLWKVPLPIDFQSATHLMASDSVSALLPEAVIELQTTAGVLGAVGIDADQSTATVAVSSTVADTILYRDPNPTVYPHDFAFYYNSVPNPTDPVHPWKGAFHLFYIRTAGQADSIIAHAWCDTLGAPWKVDTLAFRPSNLTWDKKKVWAPSIQPVGNLTYMFYTGVDSLGNQSMGYATTSLLGTTNISWNRRKAPVYTPFNTDWADQTGHEVAGVRQFRDGYVMPDPLHDRRYLLFNVGEDKDFIPSGRYAVGVARNAAGSFDTWNNIGKYPSTDGDHIPVSRIESPLVVLDSLSGAWRMFVANANYDTTGTNSTYFITQGTPGDSVTDRSVSAWSAPDSLFAYLGNDQSVLGWQATEHLQIGDVHYFAAYVGPDGIGITRMHWDANARKFFFVHPTNASVGGHSSRNGMRFYVSELRPGAQTVRFVLETSHSFVPTLRIYDLAGRRVRTLSDGRIVEGRREFVWDSRRDDGGLAAAGVYFARLTGVNAPMVVRVPLIR